MLRAFSFSLLSLALLAGSAAAQHAPARKAARKPAPRMVPNNTPAARAANPLRGTDVVGASQGGYAAPGEPITPPTNNGKNTPPYDGPAAGHDQAKKNTTLPTPK